MGGDVLEVWSLAAVKLKKQSWAAGGWSGAKNPSLRKTASYEMLNSEAACYFSAQFTYSVSYVKRKG